MQQKDSHYVSDIITVAVFLLLILGISAALLMKKDVEFSEQENRYLAKPPEMNLTSVLNGEYEKKYEAYLSDQLIFRNQWITLRTVTELLLQKKEVNGVYFAKDGYLIERKNSQLYETKLARNNYNTLSEFVKNYSSSTEGTISVLLVPDKASVLSEKLPEFADTADEQSVISKVYNQCEGVACIDICAEFMNHSDEYIYYKTDHHWTAQGSYYAYGKWCEKLGIKKSEPEEFLRKIVSNDFRGTLDSKVNLAFANDRIDIYLPTDNREYSVYFDNETNRRTSLYDMEKLNTKDKYSVYLGGNHSLVEIDTGIQNGKSILIIKDSFANCFVPYMVNQFENIYMVDLRYYNQSLGEYIKKHEITDILILYSLAGFAQDENIYKLKY